MPPSLSRSHSPSTTGTSVEKLLTSVEKLLEYATAAANALQEVAGLQNAPPYLETAAGLSLLVLDGARRVRANRAQCIQLVEQIHEVLCALVTLCGGAGGDVPTLSLSLGMLHSISQLTETLQQAHAYVSAQADTGMFKRIIKQAEHAARFEECSAGLRKALEAFGIRSNMLLQVEQMHDEARKRHEELLALMEAVRLEREEEDFDVDEDEDGSLTARNSLKSSSTSLSLLPSSPQIFHGRDAELSTCVGALCASEPARLAILGPGGMGKTSLSLSVIHDQSIEAFFGVHRYFIPLNGTSSVADMVAKIAAQFDITHQQPEKAVLRRLGEIGARAPVLVVLDNLEDCWEPSTSRAKVEDFLSLLTDVPQLHLVVTLRGVERPNKIKWTRPFLPPLAPLSLDAARDTFLDHTDDPDDLPAMTKLLALTDHLPLAICLLANLAAYEGSCTPVLERWNSQTTAMVSSGAGSDKLSSLDTSIALSLSSARIAAEPHAITLLSILALLPDGVTRSDLDEMDLPSPFSLATIARAESALVRSSLAYRDNHRVRVLAPIREYARKHCPLPMELSEPVKRHYFLIMQLFKGPATCTPALMQRLSADLGNLRSLVLYSLGSEAEIQTFECVIDLASFTYATRLGSLEGLDCLEERMEALDDPRLLGRYLHIMALYNHQKLERNTRKAIACFEKAGPGSRGELAKSHRALAFYHLLWQQNSVAIVQELTTAISIAAEANAQNEEACAHVELQAHYTRVGNITLALKHARQGHLLARAAGNIWTEASALRAQASVCGRLGDYARGVQLCAAAKKLLRALGMDNIHVTVFRNVLNTEAAIFQYQTDYAAAREINALLAPSVEEMQTQRGWSHLEISNGYALLNIASIDIATADGEDDLVRAETSLDFARALFTAHGSQFGLVGCEMTLGYLKHARGDFDGGLKLNLDMFRTMTDVDQRMILLQRIIDDAVDRNRPALTWAGLYLAFACKSNFQQKKLFALRRIADVFVAEDGDDESALAVYQMALGAFTAMEVFCARGECLVRIGDIQKRRGSMGEARSAWEAAVEPFEKSLQRKQVAECKEKLLALENSTRVADRLS